MRTSIIALAAAVALAPAAAWAAPEAVGLSALEQMPIREVTVFKDGHAMVLHAGQMPTDAAGNVVLDYLPTPLLGAFWPFSADANAKLQAVTAGQRRVKVTRTALNIRQLLEGNVGAEVTVTENTGQSYTGVIVDVPSRSGDELEATSPPNTPPQLPAKGELVLLRTQSGVKAARVDAIRDITIGGEVRTTAADEEFRNLLTLKMKWSGKPAERANVGVMYIQKGLRWIPSYKVDIDGAGKATVKLQATLVNDLADLNDVTAHLVIGVPSFAFRDMTDPIALQQQVARVQAGLPQTRNLPGYGAFDMSYALMTQAAEAEAYAPAQPPEPGPEITGGEGAEDLFVFEVQHVTLKRGERMVLPVAEYKLPYRDVYTLDVPFSPPPEVWRYVLDYYRGRSRGQDSALASMMRAPKVQHKIRLTNNAEAPLTTAPALVMLNGKLLAQGMMFYTPIGGEGNLSITAAVDITISKSDKESERTPKAVRWNDDDYMRVDLAGELKLTNRKTKAVKIEVTRYVLGNVTEAGQDGKIEMVNVFEDSSFLPADMSSQPGWGWWWGYNWPYWWFRFNGVGKISWTVDLKPGEDITLTYAWNYFWR